jgi:hypothetical protein
VDSLHLRRDGRRDLQVDAIAAFTAERFPAQLEQDAVVLRRTVSDFYVADQVFLRTP